MSRAALKNARNSRKQFHKPAKDGQPMMHQSQTPSTQPVRHKKDPQTPPDVSTTPYFRPLSMLTSKLQRLSQITLFFPGLVPVLVGAYYTKCTVSFTAQGDGPRPPEEDRSRAPLVRSSPPPAVAAGGSAAGLSPSLTRGARILHRRRRRQCHAA